MSQPIRSSRSTSVGWLGVENGTRPRSRALAKIARWVASEISYAANSAYCSPPPASAGNSMPRTTRVSARNVWSLIASAPAAATASTDCSASSMVLKLYPTSAITNTWAPSPISRLPTLTWRTSDEDLGETGAVGRHEQRAGFWPVGEQEVEGRHARHERFVALPIHRVMELLVLHHDPGSGEQGFVEVRAAGDPGEVLARAQTPADVQQQLGPGAVHAELRRADHPAPNAQG